MPWSDWITSAPAPISGTQIVGVVWSFDNIADTEGWVATDTTGATFWAAGASRQKSPASYPDPIDEGGHTLQQFTAPSDWTTRRDWFPPELFDLTEGVDFTVRPDRTEEDDDAYVQYDDGTNAVTGWDLGSLSPQFTLNSGGDVGETWQFAAGKSTTSYPVGSGIGEPGLGTTFFTGDETTTVPTNITIPAPGAVVSWSVGMDITTLPTTDGYFPQVSLRVRSRPLVKVQMPRWRYWIPGPDRPSHVRLLHRTDGLGMNPARLRNRDSHQTGRLRSYY